MPFGGRRRKCVRMLFSSMQVKIARMTIVQDSKLELSSKQKPIVAHPQSALRSAKDGIYVNIDSRDSR